MRVSRAVGHTFLRVLALDANMKQWTDPGHRGETRDRGRDRADGATARSTRGIDRYTWRGDTWWMTDTPCPNCASAVSTNGAVLACVDGDECDWWTLVEGYTPDR